MPSSHQVSPILLQEVLGFAPELLLDDLVDSANNSIYQCVNAMEEFLSRWMEQRVSPLQSPLDDPEWTPEAEVEQGLVAFQTLLENHVDIAFDFFDVWCRRNVFAFNPELPLVVPHQKGLDLLVEPKQEAELFTDIEGLKRAVDNHRRLKWHLRRALSTGKQLTARSKRRAEELRFLRPLVDNEITSLPNLVQELYTSVQSLPAVSESKTAMNDTRRRPWEASQEGYLQWAVQRLISLSRDEKRGGAGLPAYLMNLTRETDGVGSLENLRMVAETTQTDPPSHSL